MRIDRHGLVVLAALCVAAGCGDDDTVVEIPDAGHGNIDGGHVNLDAAVVDAALDAGVENDGGAEEDGGVTTESLTARKIVVHAKEFSFRPDRITAKPGEQLTIELDNDGVATHAIEFDLPGGDKRLKPDVASGDKGRLKLTAPTKKGSFDFFCPISNHRALGMKGTLVVR
jgi:plastocyanin